MLVLTLDLVMTACGFVTRAVSLLLRVRQITRPCDDRLRFCDYFLLYQISVYVLLSTL